MIITRAGGGLRVVSQVAHQEQCGLLAAAWGNEEFARMDAWDAVLTATACHDAGWREWEQHPDVGPDGTPRGFTDMDIDEHVAIHRASAAAAGSHGDRVELLVGMHVAGLVMRRLGIDGEAAALATRPEAARDLVTERAQAARRLRTRLGEGADLAAWAWSAYRVLQAIDLLSLYLTWRGLASAEEWTLRRVPRCTGDEQGIDLVVRPAPGRGEGDTGPDHSACSCVVEPWPFSAPEVDAPVASRVIDDRPYRDADDLGQALEASPPTILRMTVRRH